MGIKQRNKLSTVGAVLIAGGLIVLNILACLSTLFIVFGRFGHYSCAETSSRVYCTESIWKVGIGHDSRALFALFECDSAGVMCKIVHSELFHPTEEEYEAMQVALIPHPDGNKISMQIDGEIVYTHST